MKNIYRRNRGGVGAPAGAWLPNTDGVAIRPTSLGSPLREPPSATDLQQLPHQTLATDNQGATTYTNLPPPHIKPRAEGAARAGDRARSLARY